jgi:hypothetical protein
MKRLCAIVCVLYLSMLACASNSPEISTPLPTVAVVETTAPMVEVPPTAPVEAPPTAPVEEPPTAPPPATASIPTDTSTSSPIDTIAPLPVSVAPKIVISTINMNGTGDNEPDEYVEIRNDDTQPVALQGWTLEDKANHKFRFPDFILQPNQVCRIYTNENHPDTCGFSFGFDKSAIWNNGGDCAYLKDTTGGTAFEYCYP